MGSKALLGEIKKAYRGYRQSLRLIHTLCFLLVVGDMKSKPLALAACCHAIPMIRNSQSGKHMPKQTPSSVKLVLVMTHDHSNKKVTNKNIDFNTVEKL